MSRRGKKATGGAGSAGDAGRMRPVFTCVICGCTYLPPKTMEYPQLGTAASPLHCSAQDCRSRCATLPVQLQSVLARAAWAGAVTWRDRELSALPEQARRRAQRKPPGARSKLR
ncbi:hypothetical protein AB0K89_10425 [Streptomyces cinnamoneus]|uniref:hypothetical protein n=1 Tax=Streptomyces cinnamoneus TaxID=53446 RepID=UPI0034191302